MSVPLDPKLLEILACPVCKKPVRLTTDGSGLLCQGCRRVFPIQDDIPIMLLEESRPEDPSRDSS